MPWNTGGDWKDVRGALAAWLGQSTLRYDTSVRFGV